MFKRDAVSVTDSNEVETIIGPSVKVEGDFAAAGNVIVEGAVNGNLRTEQHLRVGEHATIAANVNAGSALIAGEIQGNLTIRENLEVTNTGKIFGDIKTKVLAVAAGAVLNGKIQVGDEPRPAKPELAAAKLPRERDATDVFRPPAKLKLNG